MAEETEELQTEEAQEAAFQEAVAQAQAEELEDESEEEMPSAPAQPIIIPRIAAAGERTGAAARALMEQIGQRVIPDSGPPSDDLSDLFKGPDMKRDNDVYIKDLVTVEEEDVFGEGGEDMSDILEVSEEDVMGDDGPSDMSDLLEVDESVLGMGDAKRPTAGAKRATFRRTRPAGMRGLQT